MYQADAIITDCNESNLEDFFRSPPPQISITASNTGIPLHANPHSQNNNNYNNNNNNNSHSYVAAPVKLGELSGSTHPAHNSKVNKVRTKVLKRHHHHHHQLHRPTLKKTSPLLVGKSTTLMTTRAHTSSQNKPHSMAGAGSSSVNANAHDETDHRESHVAHANEMASTSLKSMQQLSTVSTMREVLASIPGFSMKTRRRGNKKMSTAAQIEQTREGCIDLETPDSILVSTNLRDLLNKDTFCSLPELYQYKLVQLLPSVDRPVMERDNETIRLNPSSLTNEFFARACLDWRDRLAEGEFTPENQLKLRAEADKEKTKLDPWKLKHFEPIWGEKIHLKRKGQFVPSQLMSTASTSNVTNVGKSSRLRSL